MLRTGFLANSSIFIKNIAAQEMYKIYIFLFFQKHELCYLINFSFHTFPLLSWILSMKIYDFFISLF